MYIMMWQLGSKKVRKAPTMACTQGIMCIGLAYRSGVTAFCSDKGVCEYLGNGGVGWRLLDMLEVEEHIDRDFTGYSVVVMVGVCQE